MFCSVAGEWCERAAPRAAAMPKSQSPTGDRLLLAEGRREAVLELLLAQRAVTVAEIQERFGVSPMTARRDPAELERRGRARRTHGGAVLPSAASLDDSFSARMATATAAKRVLARAGDRPLAGLDLPAEALRLLACGPDDDA